MSWRSCSYTRCPCTLCPCTVLVEPALMISGPLPDVHVPNYTYIHLHKVFCIFALVLDSLCPLSNVPVSFTVMSMCHCTYLQSSTVNAVHYSTLKYGRVQLACFRWSIFESKTVWIPRTTSWWKRQNLSKRKPKRWDFFTIRDFLSNFIISVHNKEVYLIWKCQ